MASQFKTFFFLSLLTGIILAFGGILGGSTGVTIALLIAIVMNVGSYWFSDKIVLKMYRAKEVSQAEAPMLHAMVEELASNAGIPKPKICIVPDSTPNAFATGRNPENGVVALTEGIMRLLSMDELRGVIAHELGHITNRDILIQTVAGVLGSSIMWMAQMAQWSAIFGSGRNDGESHGNFLSSMLLAVLAPIAASLIQFAISRSREYLADAAGARISGKPLALASALNKLSTYNASEPLHEGNAATSSMFIVHPFSGGMGNLFSTHPPIPERVRRLQEMAK